MSFVNGKNGSVERSFITSLSLLCGSILLIFILLFRYAPGPSQFTKDIKSDKLTSSKVAKKQQRKSDSLSKRSRGREQFQKIASVSKSSDKEKNNISTKPVSDSSIKETEEKMQRAIDLIDAGNAVQAQLLLEGILEKDPNNEQALVELGLIHLIDFRAPDAALPLLERALTVNAGNRVALSELVGIYEETNSADHGLDFLLGLQQSGSVSNSSLNLGIGQILVGQGRSTDAIPYLENAAKAADADEFAVEELADAYSASNLPAKAADAFKMAVDAEKKRIEGNSFANRKGEYGSERLGILELRYARELMRLGRYDEVQALLDDLNLHLPDDDEVSALAAQVQKKRAG
ncbi:MAG: tetratricopeptide repeat protein [Bdellovibrionota bacterium]